MEGENAVYLDYKTYLTLGGSADFTAFSRMEYLAEKRIDRYTQSRVKAMQTVPEAVQRCITELVNAMEKADPTETASTAALSGFSNDGYSESYAQAVTADTLEYGLYRLIADHLAMETDDNGTPLLWLGVGA